MSPRQFFLNVFDYWLVLLEVLNPGGKPDKGPTRPICDAYFLSPIAQFRKKPGDRLLPNV